MRARNRVPISNGSYPWVLVGAGFTGADLRRPSSWAVEWNSPNSSALFGNGAIGKFVMPSQSDTRPEGRNEVNLKLDDAPNPNAEKKPDNSVGDPTSGAQASPRAGPASKQVDAPQAKRPPQ